MQVKSIQIIDHAGRIVLAKNETDSNKEINISTLKSGIYIVKSTLKDGSHASRSFIKN